MTTHRPHDHVPPTMAPVNPATYGRPADTPVNMDEAWGLAAAALDGCKPCQRRGMYAVTSDADPLPATHLIATAYNLISAVLAPVTGPMDDAHLANRYAEPTQHVFRALRDEGPAAAAAVVATFNRDKRRTAVDDALDLICGLPGALEVLRALETPTGPGPFEAAGVKVVTLDELELELAQLPQAPRDLLVGWSGPYAALVADHPPALVAGKDGPYDPHQKAWMQAGFAVARHDTPPPQLPAGWAVRLRTNTLEAILAPPGPWWSADAAGLAVQLPAEWVEAARTARAVAILVGDIGLDRTDDLEATMRDAVTRGRVCYGLARLQEGV